MDIYEFLKTSKAYNSFYRDVIGGKAVHAYILYSQDKYAIAKLSTLFACTLLCKSETKPCLKCSNCERIIKGLHPDCQIQPTSGDKILVGHIDSITQNVNFRPCEGDEKVFIIGHGETMNTSSQNKLLKTLEEPVESVYIIITTTNTEILLPTVKSRCRTINLELFSQDKIYDYLISIGEDKEKSKTVSKLCGGMIGKALDMTSNQSYIDIYNYIYGLFDNLNTYDDVAECIANLRTYSDKTEILDIMQLYFRDCLVTLSGQGNYTFSSQGFKKVYYSAKSLIYFIEQITQAKKKLGLNCNYVPVFETLLLETVQQRKR